MSAAEMLNQTQQMMQKNVQEMAKKNMDYTQDIMANIQKLSSNTMNTVVKHSQAVSAKPLDPTNTQKTQEAIQQVMQDVIETASSNTQRCFDYMQECMKEASNQFNQAAETVKGKK